MNATMKRRPSALHRLAMQKPRVVDDRPDWGRGILMMLAAVLALGWIDSNDRRVAEQENVAQTGQAAAHWRERAHAVEQTAAVRLINGADGGFECALHNIQREWELVIAAECKRFAGILRTARGTP